MKTAKYLLRETDYDDVVLSGSRISLADIFPNGVCIEMRGDEIVSIRHPTCGDDPEMMARIERGLKLMNQAILSERK